MGTAAGTVTADDVGSDRAPVAAAGFHASGDLGPPVALIAPSGTDDAGGSVTERAPVSQAGTPTTPANDTTTPEAFHVENATVNRSTVVAGEPVRITATVVNPYSTAATRRVWLHLLGEVVDVRNVTVPARSTRQVSFVRRIAAPGTYEARVNDASVAVVVEAAATETPAVPPTGETSQEAPGFTAVGGLFAVVATVWWARRRR